VKEYDLVESQKRTEGENQEAALLSAFFHPPQVELS